MYNSYNLNKRYTMDYLPEVSRIIDHGLTGNRAKLTAQVALLIKQLHKKGDTRSADALSNRLLMVKENIKGNNIFLERPVPVERDNRFPLADRMEYASEEIWLALPEVLEQGIDRFLSYLKNKDKLILNNIPVNPTMLLYGPPGTGKSKLAAYIASKLGLPLVTARADALISSYLGATSKNIRMLMDYAQATPCVLFLDEFDALAKGRDDANEIGELKRVVVSLLQNIDMLEGVILIAATNHPHLLDKAVWRRFQYKIEIALPDNIVRQKIAKKILHDVIDKKTLDLFINLTEGASGADIENTVHEYLRETILNENNVSINRLLQLAIHVSCPIITFAHSKRKEEIAFIRAKYNLSYEKLAMVFNVSKTYIAKVLKEEED